ncbi:hypothetical protein PC129_g3706 [Phytophthora cactorum]|uniref:Uncharacterized protein n=2 Tax=Phytophthora cactorum TaxID=29920 RepID=A0A329SYR7_9STRA|nr:hypothetical protein Pcac1_g9016 [Phytophthora cactorum]KAG2845855.1 hypothetical protein PC112_g1670 [Phytophthora cactorum]KAG2847417.1 hypothetical protein PC111_g795 [Phytophthora cactorum]KAG2868168.1 hypothetical protein PC113_g1329 [Phytophthora cactorum]KAG2932963.1 hypothetical protein PC114_g1610 [Phytophthora cactorum]
MESSSPPSSSPKRQHHIWSSRVHRELEKCRVAGALPRGATLRRAQISETRGLCEGEFQCFVPFVDGSDALSLVPRTDLIVRMPFSDERVAEGQAQYPFLAPEVEIRHGAIYLPTEVRERKVPKTEGEEPIFLLKLPLLEHWSPSTTLKMIVQEFFQRVQQDDPAPSKSPSTKSASKREGGLKNGHGKKPMRMRKRDVRGAVYPCQEVDPTTSTLKQTPMLLQSGNIALLMPSKEVGTQKDDDYVYVGDLISLKDVVRITPQRGKSLTLFFKDRSLSCRTFLSQYTDEIVKDLRTMIQTPRQRGADAGSAQLLPFLSAEQAEKAKEMSTKFMGRLGKVATSVSRFLRGDEDEAMEQQVDPLAKAFAEIDAQKEAFYRTPSKSRMTDITRRYQNIAEEYAYLNNQEGHVERAISELQVFIEHPKAQRILMETYAYEQSTKGIRVGPA